MTVGDPAGIGPEVCLKVAADPKVCEVAEITIHGPTTAEELEPFAPGIVSAEAGRSAYETIERAVAEHAGAAGAGLVEAIVKALAP